MNWFKFLRLVGSSKQKPLSKKNGRARKLPLRLEALEERDVPAVPGVLSVTPGTGNQLNPTSGSIVVKYSENVIGANVANNYQIFNSAGKAISIGSVQYDPVTFTATIQATSLNGGVSLSSGAYSLFLKAENIFSVSTNDPLGRPGEVVVANSGAGNVSTANLYPSGPTNPNSTRLPTAGLAAPDSIRLPTGATPAAIGTADLDGDGRDELVIAASGTNQVLIYRGTTERGYSGTPAATLALPAGANPVDMIVTSDFILTLNQGTSNVSAFRNLSTIGSFGFSAIVNSTTNNGPVAFTSGDFTGDGRLDLAVVNNPNVAQGASWTISILPGLLVAPNISPTFGGAVNFAVGVNSSPTVGLTRPTSITAGNFNGGGLDLAVGGSNGISVLLSTANGTSPGFGNAANGFFGNWIPISNGVTSVAADTYSSNGSGFDDILATKTPLFDTAGQLIGLLNRGGATPFGATGSTANLTGVVDAGIDNPGHLLFANGDVLYTGDSGFNTTSGFVTRSPIQAGLITNTSNPGGPIVITSPNHGLVDGQRVTISGVVVVTNPGSAGPPVIPRTTQLSNTINGTFYIRNVTATTFELVTAATADFPYETLAPSGTWILVPETILNVVADGTNPIQVTSLNHGLRTGQQITLSGIGGIPDANGTFFITVTGPNTFTLNGTDLATGTYTPQTGSWSPPIYTVGDNTTNIALPDFDNDGILDAVVGSRDLRTATMYLGSGDGTFLDSTFLQPFGTPRQPVVGDVNNDRIPDLVVPVSDLNLITVFLGLSQGGYSQAITLSTSVNANSRTPVALTLGDLNNDGNLDIVAISSTDSNAVVFLGNGDGTFQTALAPRTSVGQGPTDVSLADFNRDGVLDLIVGHNGPGANVNRGVTVRLGNGNGTFQNATELLTNTPVSAIATADFDRDGSMDFVAATNEAPGRLILMYGRGNGSFTSGGTFSVAPNTADILIADLNNDGYQDVATVSAFASGPRNITVLLNSLGIGFQDPLYTKVASNKPLGSIAATHLNDDAFLDLVVTETTGGSGANLGPNNTYLLYGQGNGSFINAPSNTVGGADFSSPSMLPSYVATVSDPVKLLTTFDVKVPVVETNLVSNGDFETRALTDEQGNLDGWTSFDLRDSTRGSHGTWGVQRRPDDRFDPILSPLSSQSTGTLAPLSRFRAMLDQQNLSPNLSGSINLNPDSDYEGTHALYQDVLIPSNATKVTFSMQLYFRSQAAWTDTGLNPSLDYRTPQPNQQVRVDIVDPTADLLDNTPNSAVLKSIFVTTPALATEGNIPINGIDLSEFKGRRVRIRIAAANNLGQLIVGVDNVEMIARLSDTVAPVVSELRLRNPTYLSSPTTLDQSTDLTLVGQVTDNASLSNIRQIIVDVNGDGFGGRDDVATSTFDAAGFFNVTLTGNIPAGPRTVTLRLIDNGGNITDRAFRFVVQGPSLTNWQSVGPGPIDISGAGLDYATISGKITGIAVDPRDASGNTMYISSGNGGVWRTTDGGANWRSLTDNIINSLGQRLNAPVNSVAISSNGTVFAATGVDDISGTARPGVGILRSGDDGRTWQLRGGQIFADALISKIVVDPTNPNIVYVTVTGWGTPGKPPAVYKSIDGGNNWTNILLTTKMFDPGSVTPLGAVGTVSLASVTDIIIDPFAPNRVIIGMGNIGQVPNSDQAGVWKSINGGSTWEKVVGGDGLNLGLPFTVPLSTIPGDNSVPGQEGRNIGRVILAQGTGRVGDEAVIYVAMATPPLVKTQPDGGTPDQTNPVGFLGLYKSKDNMLNFTKVMLKEQTQTIAGRIPDTFTDINPFGREGGTVGSLVVDPTNPNVVYLGGSSRQAVTNLNDPLPYHGLIRIDTGNMRDTTFRVNGLIVNDGDDIDKAARAASQGNVYLPSNLPYRGEGVYWYDLQQGGSSGFGTLDNLPGAVHEIAIDSQGRVLFGTENGLYRGQAQGFGYDYTTGGGGIIRTGPGSIFNAPLGMKFTELNGNLQIADLTSVSIDPTNPSRLYISGYGIGTALTPTGIGAWQTAGGFDGLFGNSGIQNMFQIIAVPPSPDAPPGTPNAVYRVQQFQYSNRLAPDLSTNAGLTFGTAPSAGLLDSGTGGLAAVLAVNKKKVFNPAENKFYDELLLGSDQVYVSRTGGQVWDSLSNYVPLGNLFPGAGFVSAVAFAPSDKTYFAGTTGIEGFTSGRVLIKTPANSSFIDSTGNLGSLVGVGSLYKVTSITVDPSDTNTVYVTLSAPTGRSTVFRTTNATAGTGTIWTSLMGSTAGLQLPFISAYSVVIDPRPSQDAPQGRLYVAGERGVYVSTDKGSTWRTLGVNLPAVPVVGLDFNPTSEILAAATLGRGVFTISTSRSGPYVLPGTQSPGTLSDDGTGLTSLSVTFNTPVNPETFTADSNTPSRTTVARSVLSQTEYQVARITELEVQLRRRIPPQANVNAGLSTFNSGPNGELEWIASVISSGYYFNNNFYGLSGPNFNTANQRWVEQVFRDLIGRTSVNDPDLARMLGVVNGAAPGQELNARLTVARQILGINPNTVNFPVSLEFQTRQVISLYNRYLGGNTPATTTATGIYAPRINASVAQLQARVPYLQVLAEILASTDAYQKMGRDYTLPTGVHTNSITFGNLTGVKNSNIADNNVPPALQDNFIPDLIVSASDGKLYVFKGRVGGGYNGTPDLILNLPANANPAQVAVADFNNDGKNDIAVANSGRLGGPGGESVSVFINNRAAVGNLSFAARAGYDGGNNPIGIEVADIDNDGALDLVIANRTANASGDFTANILLGNGGGNFSLPIEVVVGDNVPSLTELRGPTGIAVGNVTGSPLPDLVISGDNGLVILTNNSTTGNPNFTPLASGRLTDFPTTSVAVGDIDADGDLDIAATTDVANGQVLLFQHDDVNDTFSSATVSAGEAPRSVKLGDVDGDGKLDVVVANKVLDAGFVTVLTKITQTVSAGPPSGTILFSDSFPTTTFDALKWVSNGATVDDGTLSVDQPSPPNAARLNDVDTLTSTVVNLSSGASIILRYSYERQGNGNAPEPGNDLFVEYLNATGAWVEIDRQLGAGSPMQTFASRDVILPAGALHAGFRLRFRTTGDAGSDDWFVDDVSLAVAGNGFASGTRVTYPVSGDQPVSVDMADTNQDGLLDVGIGYVTSEFITVLNGKQQGVMQTATDRTWADWLYRAVNNRSATASERNAVEAALKAGYLAYLDGPDGAVAPVSITPTDSTNLTYTLSFPPQLLNGTYTLVVGPNTSGVNLRDFTDLNGTFTNTGNAMNQNRNAINGEYPGDRAMVRFAIDTTDTGRFITGVYADLLGLTPTGGRAPDSDGYISLSNIVEPAHQSAISTMAQNNTRSAEVTDRMVADLYQRYLRRAATASEIANGNGDVVGGSAQIQAGQLTVRDLVARILSSAEYYYNVAQVINNNPAATTPNAKWLDQVYQDLLNIPGTVSAPNFATKVANLDSGTRTHFQVATTAVFSDAALKQTITEYFQHFLGRAPTRNSDPALDETTNFNGVDLTALLKVTAAPGAASPDSRVVKQLISSAEYYRVVGGTDFDWTRQLFLKLRGRPTIDTSGTEFLTKFGTLLASYEPARQTAVAQVTGMRETRDRFYNDYYDQFLNHRVPTQAQLDVLDSVYLSNGNRLEAALASILSSPQYFPLAATGSSNSAWLDQIYQALVGGITSNNQAVANTQLTFLNSQPSTQLQSARFTVAMQVLSSTEYRRILITNFYNTYLGRSPSIAERDNLVNMMNNGTRQGGILQQILKGGEYFLHVQS